MKTIIYTRGTSSEQQKEICEAFARENNLNVLGTIEDLNELENYPTCQALLVSKRNRISRDVFAVQFADFRLREKGIKLISADGDTGRSTIITNALIEKLNATERNNSEMPNS